MAVTKRLVSTVLLAGGVVLVFAGLTSAQGFTFRGAIASVTAIVTLLYAGAVWFGGAAPQSAGRRAQAVSPSRNGVQQEDRPAAFSRGVAADAAREAPGPELQL